MRPARFENELIQEKRNAEGLIQKTDKAYDSLQQLLIEVKSKRSELEFINEKLNELALTDSLTGLKNRRYFEEQLLLLHRVIHYFRLAIFTAGDRCGSFQTCK